MLTEAQKQIAWCATATLAQLTQRFFELYGVPTRSRNAEYLRRRVAWRIQANAQGGLVEDAIDWIGKLGATAPERWHRRVQEKDQGKAPRDARLPPPGARLRREWDGKRHEVVVREAGFEFQGKSYRTLSAVAKAITGRHWNGFTFFGLQQ